MAHLQLRQPLPRWFTHLLILGVIAGAVGVLVQFTEPTKGQPRQQEQPPLPLHENMDDSGYSMAIQLMKPWPDGTSLEQVRDSFHQAGSRHIPRFDALLHQPNQPPRAQMEFYLVKAMLLLYEGEATAAYDVLERTRQLVEGSPDLTSDWLSTVIFLQGAAGLRRGENDNCVLCRGESSCIFPIQPAAVHKDPTG